MSNYSNPIFALVLIALGCAAPSVGVNAINLRTGQAGVFESPENVPPGWEVCEPEGCMSEVCEGLDAASCDRRVDCRQGADECEDSPQVVCQIEDCGLAPNAPAYTCDDGSLGGNIGLCAAADDGICTWQFRECPMNECTPEECGPAPGAPSVVCDDGSIGGNLGVCSRDADGSCGWEFRDCPVVTECTPEECGPAPLAPAMECDDGSVGGNTGVCTQVDGVCTWEFRECPRACDVSECGPAPGIPGRCSDGTPADTGCSEHEGVCRWQITCE